MGEILGQALQETGLHHQLRGDGGDLCGPYQPRSTQTLARASDVIQTLAVARVLQHNPCASKAKSHRRFLTLTPFWASVCVGALRWTVELGLRERILPH